MLRNRKGHWIEPLQHIPGDEGREDAADHLQGLLRGYLQDHHQPAQTASHRGRLQGGAADPAGRQEDDQAEEEDLPRPLAALPHRSQQQPETWHFTDEEDGRLLKVDPLPEIYGGQEAERHHKQGRWSSVSGEVSEHTRTDSDTTQCEDRQAGIQVQPLQQRKPG